jgi:translation initiation factor 5
MEPIRGLEEIDDLFYRYKMNKLIVVQEKTKKYIANLNQIADDIHTPIDIMIQFIKYNLGSSLKPRDDGYIITSDVSIDTIKQIIYNYIEHFVLCGNCKLPETLIKRRKCTLHCSACGYVTQIQINSHTRKTLEYIVK